MAWFSVVFFCASVHAVKGKQLDLSTPNSWSFVNLENS